MSHRLLTASCSPSPILAMRGRRPNAAFHSRHQLAGMRQNVPVLQNARSMTTVPRRDILLRAADEKAPDFARIDADSSAGLGNTSDEPFGPSAVLLVGLLEPEVAAFKGFMEEMGATMVKVGMSASRPSLGCGCLVPLSSMLAGATLTWHRDTDAACPPAINSLLISDHLCHAGHVGRDADGCSAM